MVKRLLLFSIFVLSQAFCSLQDNPAFPKLLQCLEISSVHPLPVIAITLAQKCLQNGERWNFKENLEDKQNELFLLFEEFGFFDEIHAKETHYDYGIVLGSLYSSVKQRVNFLLKEWKRGVRFDQVIFLTGERSLLPEKEPFPLKTEAEMMKMVWEETSMPTQLRALPLTIINALPAQWNSRPTTVCTILAWLKTNPKPGKCLFFSQQPFVSYQKTILNTLMPQTFHLETVGPEDGRQKPISVLLDNLSRCLFWELTQWTPHVEQTNANF